jgi:hypothetical protein
MQIEKLMVYLSAKIVRHTFVLSGSFFDARQRLLQYGLNG